MKEPLVQNKNLIMQGFRLFHEILSGPQGAYEASWNLWGGACEASVIWFRSPEGRINVRMPKSVTSMLEYGLTICSPILYLHGLVGRNKSKLLYFLLRLMGHKFSIFVEIFNF